MAMNATEAMMMVEAAQALWGEKEGDTRYHDSSSSSGNGSSSMCGYLPHCIPTESDLYVFMMVQ